jgi:peptide-methionine (S)-S-oxide reductase
MNDLQLKRNSFSDLARKSWNFFLFLFLIGIIHAESLKAIGYMQIQENKLKTETAIFAGGCFWCVEAVYSRLKGVVKVDPGYTGGKTSNPTYKEVCDGNTGHAEACRIEFDPSAISYKELLEVFFQVHDPTTLNRQGNDVGTQYRSAIFYHSEEQHKAALEILKKVENEHIYPDKIVTQIVSSVNFYVAEDYHNDYFEKNPNQPYCTYVVAPKVKKFEKSFQNYLK